MDTLTAEQKKIVILYRAVNTYVRSSVQSTVRFLVPRVTYVPENGCEFRNALKWWDNLKASERERLEIEYKFAAHIRT